MKYWLTVNLTRPNTDIAHPNINMWLTFRLDMSEILIVMPVSLMYVWFSLLV